MRGWARRRMLFRASGLAGFHSRCSGGVCYVCRTGSLCVGGSTITVRRMFFLGSLESRRVKQKCGRPRVTMVAGSICSRFCVFRTRRCDAQGQQYNPWLSLAHTRPRNSDALYNPQPLPAVPRMGWPRSKILARSAFEPSRFRGCRLSQGRNCSYSPSRIPAAFPLSASSACA